MQTSADSAADRGSADDERAAPASNSRRGRLDWLLLLAPVALMVALGALAIGRASMFGTEEASLWAGRLPLSKLFHLLGHLDAVHGFYYFCLHVIFQIFGSNVVTLRLPSLIGAAATVLVINLLTRKLTGSAATAAIAALLTALSPMILFWGASGRSYGIDAALALTGTLLFVRALETDASRWRWVGYALVVIVAGYLHEMTLLALAAHAVTLAIVRPGRRAVRSWLAAAVLSVVALIPLLVISAGERGQLSWIHRPGWAKVRLIITQFFGPEPATIVVLLVLIVLGAVFAMRAPDGGRLDVRSVGLPLFLVPPILLLAESRVAVPLFGGNHYIIYCLPAALMLAAVGLMRIARAVGGHRPALGWVAVALVLLGVTAAEAAPLNQLRHASAYLQDLGPVAHFVAAHSRPGDLAVYLPAGYIYTPLGYEHDFRNVTNAEAAVSPYRAALYRGVVMSIPQERANLLRHSRVWAIGELHLRHYPPRHRMELHILTKHFRLVTERSYHDAQVALYERVRPKRRL